MHFGCSIEMVNMLSSGPNFFDKFSKTYWVNLFKHIATTGYKGIELAYNPYSSDPMFFEIGRCGVPISKYAIAAKYESTEAFLRMLNNFGIEKVTSVHIKTGDTLLELLASEQEPQKVFEEFKKLAEEAIGFLSEIGGRGLVISPSPEIGWLEKHFQITSADAEKDFVEKTVDMLNEIIGMAAEKGIEVALRNEYWSLFRGEAIGRLLSRLDAWCLYSPDLAHLAIADCDPVGMIQQYRSRLGYVVFSDTSFKDEHENYRKINAEIPVIGPQRVFLDLGCGNVDLQSACKELANYTGWVICDNKKTLDPQKALMNTRWYIDHVLPKA